jgi:AcrR family transcriptional regulator
MSLRTSKRTSRNQEPTNAHDPVADSPDEFKRFLNGAIERCHGPRGERKQDRSRRRDEEILRAALRVFARDGISRSRIGDIAGEAGMPVSTIYEYYDSKEELAYQVPLARLAAFFSEYADTIHDKPTARERLRYYLWLAADFARRNPEWARVLYLELWPSVLVVENKLRESFDDYVRIIVYLIRQGEKEGDWPVGPDPYETASILNGSVNQTIITSLLYHRPRNLTAAAASIVDRTMALLGSNVGKAKPTRAKSRRAKITK